VGAKLGVAWERILVIGPVRHNAAGIVPWPGLTFLQQRMVAISVSKKLPKK
jgi:hypothetical protein